MFRLPFSPLLALAGIGAAVIAFHAWVGSIEKRGYDKCQAEHTKAAAIEDAKRREEDNRRLLRQVENAHETRAETRRNTASAAGADSAASRLREPVRALIDRRPRVADTAPAPGVPPATTQPDLLADLLGEADARLRALAREADSRGTAGASCERDYESLTDGETP